MHFLAIHRCVTKRMRKDGASKPTKAWLKSPPVQFSLSAEEIGNESAAFSSFRLR